VQVSGISLKFSVQVSWVSVCDPHKSRRSIKSSLKTDEQTEENVSSHFTKRTESSWKDRM